MISLILSPVSFSAPGAALAQPVLPRKTGRSHLRRWFTRGQAENRPQVGRVSEPFPGEGVGTEESCQRSLLPLLPSVPK